MPDQLIPVLIIVGILAVVIFGVLIMIAKFYRKVDQGRALIVNTMKSEPAVTFTGAVVYPIIHRAETMDISVKTIEIDRRAKEGLICMDNIRADIKVTFFVRVNKTTEDVLKVAQAIGCNRASDQRTIEELFNAKFSEALKTVGKGLNFEDLYKERQKFKDDIITVIGTDLNGFVLDDCAIDYLEQTPVETLDPENIMDAEGIRKITDLTVIQNVQTNELKQKERMEIGAQNLKSDEAIYNFDQRRAEADAKKNKEIAVATAREQQEAQRVAEDEHKKTLLLRYRNEEEALVANEGKERAAEVAKKNKEREIAVEAERVEKARQLEAVSREREVDLQRIAKEKDIEVKKKEIADVIRARVAVDKTVAEEEERIKDLRATAQATREKDVVTITAEGQAQEHLVKEIKAAEASEEVAKFHARKKIVEADADLEASDKSARAKIRLAEGVQAEHAAEGLATVRVKEADAQANEKQGMVEARVNLEKMQAIAEGEEKQGLAKVRVAEAEAAAIEKKGLAEALVTKEAMLAAAVGEEQKGLALVRVREADAVAIEKTGEAEASALRQKLSAEAAGLTEKAEAMKALDQDSRAHEEFRVRLETQKDVALHGMDVRKDIAEQQAEIMRTAFEKAKIQIVGGDGQFFDQFIKSISVGQSVDNVVDQSDTIRNVFGDYFNGDKNLPADLKGILEGTSSETVKNLTLSAVLGQLASGADDSGKRKLAALAQRAKDLGIDELSAK